MNWPRSTLLAIAFSLLSACTTVNPYFDATRPHHRPDGFANSDPSVRLGENPWYDILHRRLRGDFRPAEAPEGGYEAFRQRWTITPDLAQLQQPADAPRLTWLGHASLLLQVGGKNILIDPQFSDYAGPHPWLAAKRKIPSPLSIEELPPIDLVLISHNHYDHLDAATILRLQASGQRPRYLVPLGVKAWFDDLGITDVREMDWWAHQEFAPLTIHFTPAQHWSKRSPFDTNATLWGGFLIEFGEPAPWRFLYTGDTGYSGDFRRIAERLGRIDFLAVPIGAYEPRDFMRRQHANPDDAVQILLDVGARRGIGVHWGSFELTREAFDRPPVDLAAALAARGLPADQLETFRQGETHQIGAP